MSKNSTGLNAGGCGCMMWVSSICVALIFLTMKLAQIGLPKDWPWWLVLLPWYITPILLFIAWFTLKFLEWSLGKMADAMNYVAVTLRKRRERKAERDD